MTPPIASLRRRLFWRLVPALSGVIALSCVTSYLVARRSADFAYDQALIAVAADVAGGVRARDGHLAFELTPQSERILRSDARDDIYFSVRTAEGAYLGGDRDLAEVLPAVDAGGASTDIRFRSTTLRAISLGFADEGPGFVVTVAETTLKRQSAAREIFARMIGPTILVLSLAGLFVWLSVRGGLRPLDDLRSEIEARSELDLSPVDVVGAPAEVRSLVSAVNRLLARLDGATKAHQAFVADAAHQLRTPLAGIQTEIELLTTAFDPEHREPLARLRFSVGRAVRLVNQLLALARAEKDANALRLEVFDLAGLIAEAADTWVHRAIVAGIDLGFELRPSVLRADPYLIRELLENLIDNALRHTPVDGQVTVASAPGHAGIVLTVDDSGTGVPPAARERIFERFHRESEIGTGSGLGLAIVHQIAVRHGGQAVAGTSAALGGLCLSVTLPVGGPDSRFEPTTSAATSAVTA
jgi:two-component system sensor histidine kinase TctE